MDSKHHIALICASLNGGGAQRILLNLSSEFARRGHQVDLVLGKKEGDYLDLVSKRVRIVDLGASRMLATVPSLIAYFRRERPDATLSTLSYVNALVSLAYFLSGSSTHLVLREAAVVTKQTSETKPSLFSKIIPMLRNITYPLADDIIAISNNAADHLITNTTLTRDSVSVIHNPAYFPSREQRALENVPHPWLTTGFNEPVVLGMGRLGTYKNFDLIIRSVAAISKERPIRLILCGKGPLQSELEQLADDLGISDRVSFPGFVTNPFAYMRRADVFVLSSIREAFGNVLVEALATGTPVVSTNCPGGPAEILEDGKWGRLVPIGDPDAMAKAIEATLDEPTDAECLKSRAQDFNVDKIAGQYLSVLLPNHNLHG